MTLIDTHCHLDEDAFSVDRGEVIERAVNAGVAHILTIGTTAASSISAVDIAVPFKNVSAVVGIQPNYVAEAKPDDWQRILDLAGHEQVVGIGETGLDRYWDYAPLELQQEFFDRHIELSGELGKPFVVHCRDAESDVVAQLRRHVSDGPLSGVMHSFSGDQATADACLEMGLHISFAGMVTYKKNDGLRAVAASIPADRILVETDAPYLAPVPMRGKRNEPSYVKHTAECLAEVRGVPTEEFAAQTTANARHLFRLP